MENKKFIKVWDIAIRLFHWTLVGCCALAFIGSEAFADRDEKGESDDHKRRSRAGEDFQIAEENEKDEFWEEVHETIAYFPLFLAAIHIAGALLSSMAHRENLIKAMITGRKQVV